jgi:WD40 repeat protein
MIEESGPTSPSAPHVLAASFSPDGKYLITGSLEGILAEWDVSTGHRVRMLLDPAGVEDAHPELVLVEDGREMEAPFRLVRLSEPIRGSSILSVRFSPDGKYFAVGSANGGVVVWNARSRGELHCWRAHEQQVVAIDISHDNRWLATGALEEGGTTLRIWKLKPDHPREGREVFSDQVHVGGVWALEFSPDSRFVAVGGATYSGYTAPIVYDFQAGKRVGTLLWDITRALRYSPDGKLLATGDENGAVKLWDVRESKQVLEIEAHAGIVSTILFSPDGRRLVSGSDDGAVKIWDVETDDLLQEFPMEGRILDGRFFEDGSVLYAASAKKGSDRPTILRLA